MFRESAANITFMVGFDKQPNFRVKGAAPHLLNDTHVIDDDSWLLDVLPHELVVVGGEEGAAATLEQVPRHTVSNSAAV